ncbi:amidohydrolase family protein [Pseudopedobacter saltans]|nr:amidohydrolase family protein [Pseudopedobacter saltans]
MNTFFRIILFVLISSGLHAQWNIEKPSGPTKTTNFSTNEGTWMNLDVSPDGKFIVFDLLGDIYKMPVTGGDAELLAGGLAWEVQPRFSPDGKLISYTSDKDGADNIWIMNADGSGKRAITKENINLLNNAVWTPDGQYLVARKNFLGRRTNAAGELWMYHVSGGFEGTQLTQRKRGQRNLGEPFVSKSGKELYYSEDISPAYLQYNKDPNGEIYQIKRLILEDETVENVAGGTGGAVRPQVSPNGKYLAYVKRNKLKTNLMIQDLETGEEFILYDDLSRDLQESKASYGLYPNFNWLPDNKTVIFYAKGKINKIDILYQMVQEIPFKVNVKQTISEALHYDQKVFNEEFDAKMIRQLVTSPDLKKVAFSAGGYIYVKNLPDGKPERLTTETDWEFDPCFSPDGNFIIYTSWNDELKGSIMKIDLSSKKIDKLTPRGGFYYTPKFSNKGDLIVYRKGVGNDLLGFTFSKNPGIYTISANGGEPKLILKEGLKPQFNKSDNRIFYTAKEDGKNALKSCDLSGNNIRTHYTTKLGTEFILSPDNRWLAFSELFDIYLTPFIATANGTELASNTKSFPVKKVSGDVGNYIHWNKESKALHWTLGSRYYTKEIKDALAFSNDTKDKSDTLGLEIALTLKTDVPQHKIAFKGATIITMKDNEIIPNGTILIDQNKIVAIGKDNEVNIPDDAIVYPAYGKTIIPGFIDVHAHLKTSPDGIIPQQNWAYYANLAYGITTAHDPSTNMEMASSQAEMIKAGRLVGPRLFAAGSITGDKDTEIKTGFQNLAEIKSHLKRMQAIGTFTLKSSGLYRRDQRQQLVQAAREQKMMIIPEGEYDFFTSMNMIADGHSSIEHNIPVLPVYKDVSQFWNASKTSYTPTLIIANGSQFGENYWYDRINVWENQKLLNFIPRHLVDSKSRRRTTSEYGDYGHIDISRVVNQIANGGTKVNLGSNGRLQGLGAHWELWMLGQGGMKPHDILKVATINGAEYLGMDRELGSLEKGKLADLIVLNRDPLQDIRNTESIKYVMVNGRLYDAESMNELGQDIKPINKFWWQFNNSENYMDFSKNAETWTFSVPDCE